MKVSEAEFEMMLARRGVRLPPKSPATAPRPDRALGRLEAGEMNRTEAAYAEHLELRRRAGEVVSYGFEAIKLRLARKTFYTPDFFVVRTDGVVEIHEVKGGPIEDDAAVKIKVAAEQFPCFVFVIARKVRMPDRRIAAAWVFKEVRDGL